MNQDINLNNANATNKKISELYRDYNDGALILQPEFQRKFVWNVDDRKRLIDTILSGLPFPEIYIADNGVDLDSLSSQEVVVDGQQRLTSIVQYINGELKIGTSDIIKPFAELDPQARRNFLNYKVTVRQLVGVDALAIKEIFRRINLTKYPLNSYEIHNAIYDGAFMQTAKELVELPEIQKFEAFHLNENGRMQELGLMLLIMSTLEQGGQFSGDGEIEKYLKKYNDDYPPKPDMVRRIKKVAKLISSLGLDPDTMWLKRTNLFTLLVALANEESPPNDLADRLRSFEQQVQLNKTSADKDKNDYSLYYFYTTAGTSSRKARVTREEIFRKYIFANKP